MSKERKCFILLINMIRSPQLRRLTPLHWELEVLCAEVEARWALLLSSDALSFVHSRSSPCLLEFRSQQETLRSLLDRYFAPSEEETGIEVSPDSSIFNQLSQG